jgi:phosphosulfolactate synthase
VDKDHIFSGLDGKARSAKPRTVGRTMVADWGMGPNQQADLLSVGGPYFEFAKIAVGMSRMYSNDVLRHKISVYRSGVIEAFPGGQFLEYAEMSGKIEGYLPACQEAGYRWIEVSDNIAPVSLDWKVDLIRRAVTDYDMQVFGEVGKKEGLAHGPSFVEDAKACRDAGAAIILLEAAELVNADASTARDVENVVEGVGIDVVMFELPGPWIAGVSLHDIHTMRREIVDRYGNEVNVGNVAPDELFSFEAYRRGLGVNAGSSE